MIVGGECIPGFAVAYERATEREPTDCSNADIDGVSKKQNDASAANKTDFWRCRPCGQRRHVPEGNSMHRLP